MPLYKKIFNHILCTGEIPGNWTVGNIIPIYKNKGDKLSPENYRGISILSCFGKFVTGLVNYRLTSYVESNNILLQNQTGFRKGYSTMDHVFVLKGLMDIFMSKKKKIFCAFVDFKKAFDMVWRSGLWIKLISSGITGKLFNVIKNMYQDIKSGVMVNGDKSPGVRQGESLSPLLFALFLNDRETFVLYNDVNKLSSNDPCFDKYSYYYTLMTKSCLLMMLLLLKTV